MGNAASFVPNLLANSTTSINRASYVPLTDPEANATGSGRATNKASFVAGLQLGTGEVGRARDMLSSAKEAVKSTQDAAFWDLLTQYESPLLASALPVVSSFVDIAASDLIEFGSALISLRKQDADRLAKETSNDGRIAFGTALIQLNTAHVVMGNFKTNSQAMPVGMLNLERLEMTPVGIERGGLLATIPLAPKERTFVTQKEWSVTTQEFTSIVTDSLDNFSETGVTENTQLTSATSSQVARNNQFNVTASASGGIGFVSGSASSSFGTQDTNSQSATASRKNSIQTTRLASSRVKQSHKISISTTSVEGTSEATTRKIENPSATEAMRIDYFSMMRKWYVALYRYGMRLTYDLTIPEPGATLREIFAKLDVLQKQANGQFVFPVKHSDITTDVKPGDSEAYYLVLADRYSVDVPAPPQAELIQTLNDVEMSSGDVGYKKQVIDVQSGYWITKIVFTDLQQGSGVHVVFTPINATGLEYSPDHNHDPGTIDPTMSPQNDLCNNQIFLYHATGSQEFALAYTRGTNGTSWASFVVHCEPTDAAMAQWRSQVWSALYNAAQTQFYAQQQAISAQITVLQNQINGVDTLTLRREENDEIMKGVLRWLLTPQIDFAFMQPPVEAAFEAAAKAAAGGNGVIEFLSLYYGVNFTGDQTQLSKSQWSILNGNEEIISFINEAIEWENVTFFTYSYFWDYPLCWDFIRQIQHPDATRQAFLRAGSARVVLTVRQGWELAWTHFVNTGKTKLPDPPYPPYMTIAQQIAAYDSTNYPGIPPANPDGGGLIDDNTPQTGTTCESNVDPAPTNPASTAVPIPVDDASGFVVGATAILDTWDAQIDPNTNIGPGGLGIGAQESQTIVAVDSTSAQQTVTVQRLLYSHIAPFPVVQSGAKGVLIGEWYEYTPTSGTDIGVTLNPTGPMA